MKPFRSLMSRALCTLAAAGLAMVMSTGQANAAVVTFTVNEGAVPGALPLLFDANGITGKYGEIVSLDPVAGTFDANIVVNFSQYTISPPNPPAGVGFQLTATPGADPSAPEALVPNLYNMYALVNVTGNFTSAPDPTDPGRTIFDFDPLDAEADIYLDPKRDSTKSVATLTVVDPSGDDLQILTASTIKPDESDGKVTVQGAGTVVTGSYAIVFTDPTVVAPTGPLYWPDLVNLVFRAIASGDVDPATGTFPSDVIGDTSLSFQVPEPAALSVFGIGLLGAGIAARRRRRSI